MSERLNRRTLMTRLAAFVAVPFVQPLATAMETASTDRWIHYAVTASGTYMDGVRTGAGCAESQSVSCWAKGPDATLMIEDLRIYDRELTANEIKALLEYGR